MLLHLSGKRQLAQLNSFDLVVLLLLSNVVQNAVIGDDLSLTGGLLGAAILVGGNYLVVRFVTTHSIFKKLLGEGTPLVKGGEVDEVALRRQRITRPELDAALRQHGVEEGVDGVECAVLEPEGALTPYPKHPTLEQKVDEILALLKNGR